jgi:hypothetical protein
MSGFSLAVQPESGGGSGSSSAGQPEHLSSFPAKKNLLTLPPPPPFSYGLSLKEKRRRRRRRRRV